ncbi:hypothetical protein J6590_002794 [Homalodisca vitripennis]|nr:hypothetical protein J6590_002794 [Homalodisca vitripennis]
MIFIFGRSRLQRLLDWPDAPSGTNGSGSLLGKSVGIFRVHRNPIIGSERDNTGRHSDPAPCTFSRGDIPSPAHGSMDKFFSFITNRGKNCPFFSQQRLTFLRVKCIPPFREFVVSRMLIEFLRCCYRDFFLDYEMAKRMNVVQPKS